MAKKMVYGDHKMSSEKIAIILAHELVKTSDGLVLSEQTRERMDRGIDLLTHEKVTRLLLSGGCEHKWDKTLAQVMTDYALSHGVEDDKLVPEDISRDTAAQLIFSKKGILVPRDWKDIILITHDYHGKRTRKEAEFVFGPQYNLRTELIPSKTRLSTPEKEEASYQTFLRTFEGIEPGDDRSILNRLLKKHPLYKDEAKEFRRRLRALTYQT